MKRILILCPYPAGRAPSQRFRFEQYLGLLRQQGFKITQESFWDEAAWDVLYKPGHRAAKVAGVMRGIARRLRTVARARDYDYVFIHLAAMPVGPPVIEALLAMLGRRIIYDIDDAIFLRNPNAKRSLLDDLVRWRSKVAFTTKHSYKVLSTNAFLVDWASKLNERVFMIPTTVDPDYHTPGPEKQATGPVVLGWTGTHTTAPYLEVIRPALKRLQARHPFRFRVICNIDPGFPELDDYEFVPWRKETEIEDLRAIDIGLMPLPEEPWTHGKLGFKAIQYGALGIPAVVSNVGSGGEVIEDERTGLLVANTEDAWVDALLTLLSDETVRRAMGAAARAHVLARFSIPSQAHAYVGLFE